MMRKRISMFVLAAGFALGAVACDDGGKKEDPKAAKAGGAKADGGKAAAGDDAGKPAAGDDAAAGDDGAAAGDDGDDGAAADGGDAPDDAAPAYDERVTKAVKLAKAIEAAPEKVDDVLSEAGLERSDFEAMIYEISADAALAKQYQAARAADAG